MEKRKDGCTGNEKEGMNKRAETSRDKAAKFAHGPDASIGLAFISRGNKATQKKEQCLQSSGTGAAIQDENVKFFSSHGKDEWAKTLSPGRHWLKCKTEWRKRLRNVHNADGELIHRERQKSESLVRFPW